MRNQFAGKCYKCGMPVAKLQGHFERFKGGWRTQHSFCTARNSEDPNKQAEKAAFIAAQEKPDV